MALQDNKFTTAEIMKRMTHLFMLQLHSLEWQSCQRLNKPLGLSVIYAIKAATGKKILIQ